MRRAASGALLIGRIFDDRGNRMTPSTAKKGSIRYRYYVSSVLAQGRKSEAGAIARVSASEIEAVVVDALRAAYPDDADLDDRALIEARVERVVLGPAASSSTRAQTQQSPIEIAWSPPAPRGRREILAADGSDEPRPRHQGRSPHRAAALDRARTAMARRGSRRHEHR